MLADLLADQGQHEEAERLCAAAREAVNADDLVDVIALDALQGFLATRRGELGAGESLGNRAAARSRRRSTCTRARRGHTSGRPARSTWPESRVEAREAAAKACAIYEAKGDVLATAWATALLESLSG